jgi:hypothetical protein
MAESTMGARRCGRPRLSAAREDWTGCAPGYRGPDHRRPRLSTATKRSSARRATMSAMDMSDPTSRRTEIDADILSEVATLVRAATYAPRGSTYSPRRSPPPDT